MENMDQNVKLMDRQKRWRVSTGPGIPGSNGIHTDWNLRGLKKYSST